MNLACCIHASLVFTWKRRMLREKDLTDTLA